MKALIKINNATRGHGKVLADKGYEVEEVDGYFHIECNEVIDGDFDSVDDFVAAIKEAIPAKNLFSYRTTVAGVKSLPLIGHLSSKAVGAAVLTAFIAKAPTATPVAQKSLADFDI